MTKVSKTVVLVVMEKDFDGWNNKKKELEAKNKKGPRFREREIWWCSIGHNLGHEACGKNEFFERPILIIHKYSSTLFIGIPLTSAVKNDRFHFCLNSVKYHIKKTDKIIKPYVMLSHIKSLSSVRLIRSIDIVSRSELKKVQKELYKWI